MTLPPPAHPGTDAAKPPSPPLAPTREMLEREEHRAHAEIEWAHGVRATVRSRQRRRVGIGIGVLAIGAIGLAGWVGISSLATEAEQPAGVADDGYFVGTPGVFLTMPRDPVLAEGTADINGTSATYETWTLDEDDDFLEVRAWEFTASVSDTGLQVDIDAMIDGLADEFDGEVVANVDVATAGASSARQAEITEPDDTHTFVAVYVVDRWMVAIIGTDGTANPPADWLAVDESVVLRPSG